jgi:acetyl esterase/lipase
MRNGFQRRVSIGARTGGAVLVVLLVAVGCGGRGGRTAAANQHAVTASTSEAREPDCASMPCPPPVPADAPHCSWNDDHQIAYEMPRMSQVSVTCDIRYGEVEGIPMTLDRYLPADARPGDELPAVIFVHGNDLPDPLHPLLSHWKRWEYTRGLLAGAMGYVGIAFDYRGYDDAETLGAAQQDVLDLLSYVEAHAADLMIDPDRMCLFATSGGGIPAAWAAIRGEPRPVCVVMMSATGDAPWAGDHDPTTHVSSALPPFFFGRGKMDDYSAGNAFIDAARDAGVEVLVEEHPGGHGFENERDPRQQRIVGDALAFLSQHLGMP